MKISEMTAGKYIKKEDLAGPKTLTISACVQENVAMDNQPEEYKFVLSFQGEKQKMVLNNTNTRLVGQVTGEDDSDNWIGKQITIWNDMSVSFNGKFGGIRVVVSAPAIPVVVQKALGENTTAPAGADDIPF